MPGYMVFDLETTISSIVVDGKRVPSVHGAQAKEIKNENGIVSISCYDMKSKGKIIGRDRHNIKWINDVVKRYFDISEVKVI